MFHKTIVPILFILEGQKIMPTHFITVILKLYTLHRTT